MGIIKEEFYKRLKEDEEIEKLSQIMESLYEDYNNRLLTIFSKDSIYTSKESKTISKRVLYS